MSHTSTKSILFDDFAILKGLVGLNELTRSAKVDSDCIGYSSTSNEQDDDTDKVSQPIDASR